MLPSGVHERDELAILDGIAEDYERSYGSPPFDLSHWNPSTATMKALSGELRLPDAPAIMPYLYSEELAVRNDVRARLGFSDNDYECQIVPTGTAAILCAVHWLKSVRVSRLLVVCPSYFPVFYDCEMMGLPYARLYMSRQDNTWSLPKQMILEALHRESQETAIWLTNPVYCTGVYLTSEDRLFIDSLLAKGIYVVIDECLSLRGHELGPQLSKSDHLIGLYSPHKAVCINAIKFSAIIHTSIHTRMFRHWSDVLVGGLGVSNHAALVHFTSDNYPHYERAFLDYVSTAMRSIASIAARYRRAICCDEGARGYFVTWYFKAIRSTAVDTSFIRDLVYSTAGMVIPGSRNHFSPDLPFSFRLNLARASPQFFATAHRIASYLDDSEFPKLRDPETPHFKNNDDRGLMLP